MKEGFKIKGILITLFFGLLISGCHDESNQTSTTTDAGPRDFSFDQFTPTHETPDGLLISAWRWATLPELEDIDTWYAEAQQCVADQYAILYPSETFEFFLPPEVVITSVPGKVCEGNPDAPAYCLDFETPFVLLDTDSALDESKWKEGFILHILYLNDFDSQMVANRQPQQIWDCRFN